MHMRVPHGECVTCGSVRGYANTSFQLVAGGAKGGAGQLGRSGTSILEKTIQFDIVFWFLQGLYLGDKIKR